MGLQEMHNRARSRATARHSPPGDAAVRGVLSDQGTAVSSVDGSGSWRRSCDIGATYTNVRYLPFCPRLREITRDGDRDKPCALAHAAIAAAVGEQQPGATLGDSVRHLVSCRVRLGGSGACWAMLRSGQILLCCSRPAAAGFGRPGGKQHRGRSLLVETRGQGALCAWRSYDGGDGGQGVGQAAWYSWTSPPSRSVRLTRRGWSMLTGGLSVGVTGMLSSNP